MLLLLAMLVGAIVPVQTAINTRLRQSVGSPIGATFVSFIIAVVVASVISWGASGALVPDLSTAASQPWWAWLGGFMGVMFIAGNIVLFPKLGPVQTVILPILGQVIMGLAIDRFGLFGAPVLSVSFMRVLGAVVVLAGIVMVLRAGKQPAVEGDAVGLELWLFRALGVLVGVGSAVQTAVNGYLGTIAGSSMHAGEINLAVGALLLLVAVLVTSPRQLVRRPEPGPWWMWLGGLVGATFVISGATLAPLLGTATTVIAFNAGTIAAGQALEARGAFGARRNPLTATRLAGLVVIFLGVLAVRLL